MKKFLVFLFLSTSILLASHAQDQLPTKKKIIAGQDGKLYIPKEQGLYVWLSTSPDADAKKHRLLSDSTKRYTNPMFLDTEGYNTFRSPSAVDPKTKRTVYPIRDIVFEVYADGVPPISTLTINYSKTLSKNNIRYYKGENLTASITAKDRFSGPDKSLYSINGTEFKEMVNPVALTENGEISLKYYSTDKVGNAETIKETKFIVDNTAPVTTADVIQENVESAKFLKLESSDQLVGVKTIFYHINDGSKKVYSKPIELRQLNPNSTISYYAVDLLGNQEKPKEFTLDSE